VISVVRSVYAIFTAQTKRTTRVTNSTSDHFFLINTSLFSDIGTLYPQLGIRCDYASSSRVTCHCPDLALWPPSRSLKCHPHKESALVLLILTSDLQNRNRTEHKHKHTTDRQKQQKHQHFGMWLSGSVRNKHTDDKQT
jgi:hypothetical protein